MGADTIQQLPFRGPSPRVILPRIGKSDGVYSRAMDTGIFAQLERHARVCPGEMALCEVERPGAVTWAELHARVTAAAQRLRENPGAGSTVLLMAGSGVSFCVALLGALRADCGVLPLSAESTEPELLRAAVDSGAAAVIGDEEVCGRAARAGRVPLELASITRATGIDAAAVFAACAGRGALLLYGSGRCGLPRLVRRGMASVEWVIGNCVDAVGLTEADRVMTAVPLHHAYGIEHGLLAPLMARARIDLLSPFDPSRMVRVMRERGTTILPGVPFVYESLVLAAERDAASPLPELRRAYSAGAPLPREVYDAFAHRFGTRIGQVYGSTEFGSATFSDPDDENFDPLGVGVAMPGVELRIVDEEGQPLPAGCAGRVAVASCGIFDGYEPCWFITGDVGRLDGGGRLTITRTAEHLINIDGRKVNPLEVQAVLMEYPGVRWAEVGSMAVMRTVNRLTARIVPEPGASVDAAELARFVKGRLIGYKVPRRFDIVVE